MFKVTFRGRIIAEIDLERELSLLTVAAKNDLPLTHRCGGHARCGTCLVTVEEGQEQLTVTGSRRIPGPEDPQSQTEPAPGLPGLGRRAMSAAGWTEPHPAVHLSTQRDTSADQEHTWHPSA